MKYLVLVFFLAGCSTQDVAMVNGDPDTGNPAPGGVGGGPTADPYNTPPVCTSNAMWTRGDRGSALMHPGVACISCHDSEGGPGLAFGGTVYPTAHEPDDCNGQPASAQVIVTDAAGHMLTVNVNSAGNFYMRSSNLTFPITAKVVANGKTREMTTPSDSGDCNSCHTETGTMMAPGRIMMP